MFAEVVLCLSVLLCSGNALPFSAMEGLTEFELREMIAKMGNELVDFEQSPARRMDLHMAREPGPVLPEIAIPIDYDELSMTPSLRDREYLSHSTLLSANPFADNEQMKPNSKPSQSTSNKAPSELKADGVLPAYCNPPNPCPLGYTEKDGCVEEFENTAGFSHDYQAMQECMCDTEHMFQCADSSRDSEITALARSIQNEGLLDSTVDKIMQQLNLNRASKKAFSLSKNLNPFLRGERLPIAAKKGNVY